MTIPIVFLVLGSIAILIGIARVDEALAYMNLTEFKNRPPYYLSGGEKKRVSIADIIAMQSEMIILPNLKNLVS